MAATDQEAFYASVLAAPDLTRLVDDGAVEFLAPPAVLLDRWRAGRVALAAALTAVPGGDTVPWYGTRMSAASMATARIMETWAHGEDVAEALGVVRTPTGRLRHVVHLGFRTLGHGFAAHGRAVPTMPVRVELTAPDGSTWAYGPADAADRVTGPALDFCLLVTQRRHRADLALVATGPTADAWLDVAQAFAGPPGAGRKPDTTDPGSATRPGRPKPGKPRSDSPGQQGRSDPEPGKAAGDPTGQRGPKRRSRTGPAQGGPARASADAAGAEPG